MSVIRPQRAAVTSSSIASLGYAAVQRVLDIEFRRGAVYRFFDVPEKVFSELLDAQSKGLFFNARIKDHFPYERIHH
jgi:lysyl-tRNA synthetase class 2